MLLRSRVRTREIDWSLGTLLIALHWVLLQPPHPVAANTWMYLGVVSRSPNPQIHMFPQDPTVGPTAEPEDEYISPEARAFCGQLPILPAPQMDLCLHHPGTLHSVSLGAARGINECQMQFRNERWNCSTQADENRIFGYTLERGSKETAFIYAVTSAGVVHAVTEACSSGNLTDCSCDASRQGLSTREGWKWGGCSDNLQFGIQFARKFVDSVERINKPKKGWNVRMKMNLHNNEAGRQVVSSMMRMQCRCHGVSGSCELKTCWQTMPPFNEIGDTLKKKYRLAVQVASKKKQKRLRRKSKSKHRAPLNKGDLVHIHKSPNYCVEDPQKGIPGTVGRICNKTSTGPDSCDLLCCGRGYNTQVKKHVDRCHCKFVWCCYVKCKTCETQIDLHTCK